MITANLHKQLTASGGLLHLQVQFEVTRGECVALYGESGSGKTSVLRMLAGLLTPDAGEIRVNGQTWYDARQKIHLTPQRRAVGFMFQDYGLFPHLTVRQNLTFALPKPADASFTGELIEVMELEGLLDQKPGKLSGGQQQRVALARTLGTKPQILLLDEPLSALDQRMREQIGAWLGDFFQKNKLTVLLVSHSPAEISRLAHRVLRLEAGRVQQSGPPTAFFPELTPPDITFTATVQSLEMEGDMWNLTLVINDQTLHIRRPVSDFPDLKAGDYLPLSARIG